MRSWVGLVWCATIGGGCLLLPDVAQAEITGENSLPILEAPEPERRGDFMIGLSSAYGVGFYSGYQNKLQEIGRPEFRTDINGDFANTGSIWIGGALRDWISFGLGVTGGSSFGDTRANGGAFTIRVESFPLYSFGGFYRDLGLTTEFGAGGMTLVDQDDETLADGGNMSFVTFAAFWEAATWWKLNVGPVLSYTHMSSESLTANTVGLGLRTTFYGSP